MTTMTTMSRTWIKICGIRDIQTATVAAKAGADAIGLVFAPGSPRQVTPDQARKIVLLLPKTIEPIGLFVDATADQIRETADEVGLRTVQLHGSETPDDAAALSPLRVIKAVGFKQEELSDQITPWKTMGSQLAAILVDAPREGGGDPSQSDAPSGGSGRRYDWSGLATSVQQGGRVGGLNVILAGGLTPENVGRGVTLVKPYGVDVSSGVESSRGVKDPEMIRAFCDAVRRGDAENQNSA